MVNSVSTIIGLMVRFVSPPPSNPLTIINQVMVKSLTEKLLQPEPISALGEVEWPCGYSTRIWLRQIVAVSFELCFHLFIDCQCDLGQIIILFHL